MRSGSLWNDNLFGMENKDQFDFGLTVLFGGKNIKSIFGPRTKEGENTNTNKIIHAFYHWSTPHYHRRSFYSKWTVVVKTRKRFTL